MRPQVPHSLAQPWSEPTASLFPVVGGREPSELRHFHARPSSGQLLQRRYIFVGWDSMIAMEALGIDPMQPDAIVNDVAVAHCSAGSLLRQMYVSGPSGLVGLSGDYIFTDGGFFKAPVKFHFSIKKALAMGLCGGTNNSTSKASSALNFAVTNATSENQRI